MINSKDFLTEPEMEREYQICQRCVMDTTDLEIVFDEHGYCNHCKSAIKKLSKIDFKTDIDRKTKLQEIVNIIKKSGKDKKYDCIIGLSGGVDSSYLAYIVVKELGLRPLAVHVDNGWNSELAIQNIENIVKKLGIDLHTWVIDWEEFKQLQLAFLKASVVDLEMLSDNAIVIAIYKLKKKFNIKYFIDGTNLTSESIMPSMWYFSPKFDSLNILSIYKRFGNGSRLHTYPLLNFWEYIQYFYFKKGQSIGLLNYINYKKDTAKTLLINEFNWRDYGGKHYESKITQFYQAYILPNKFNIDKRKAHLASLIVSGQITREKALVELSKPLYDEKLLKEDQEYFTKKLDLSLEEFNSILKNPPISHLYYPSFTKYHSILVNLKNRLTKR